MMKKAMRRRPASRRRRTCSMASGSPIAMLDIAGSSAADTDMPNRLTGSVYSVEAFESPVTAPVPSRLAIS
jgi:hypothetical protein